MRLSTAKKLAEQLIQKHLPNTQYKFYWFSHLKVLGECNYRMPGIGLNRRFVAVNPKVVVKDIILHEIAHALTPKDKNHGKRWRAVCRRIGCIPKASPSHPKFVVIKGRYCAVCDVCDEVYYHDRKTKGNICRCQIGKYPQEELFWEKTKNL